MADDDEVDVLGDFSLDTVLAKADTTMFSPVTQDLLADYAMPQQWLLDLEPQPEVLSCTEDSVSDESGWTEREKSLLDRGIEIFGRSALRLAQFVGSRTTAEVRHYLRHFYKDVRATCEVDEDVGSVEEVVGETEIPASIEEVISVVSSANEAFDIGCTNGTKSKLKEKTGKGAKFKFSSSESDSQEKTVAEIVTGKGLSVPMCEGEEVVKISKENSDESESDVEIDIEDEQERSLQIPKSKSAEKPQSNEEIVSKLETSHEPFDLPECDDRVRKELMSIERPKAEAVLDFNDISTLEKVMNNDFFEGSPAKSPMRYLKIRNHILNVWLSNKPSYVSKTATRQGLKNCGDVNCIGRIHTFLEQIGAINFRCSQISYVRPLVNLLQTFKKEKEKKSLKIHNLPQEVVVRPRIKKKFNNDGEGGCTLTHGEQGEIINTHVVNEEPAVKKMYIKKPTVKLIYCRPFPKDNPYHVNLELSALILMDLHSHTSLTEVMGLIGGIWNSEKRTLIILHYEPCRNLASSTIHCDMCPVSQARAADIIHSKGLNILGWFHSHPTFAPEPSQQDLDTQLSVQKWIGSNKPCIGVILSPYGPQGALIASPYRCLVVQKKENFEDQFVPYKFKVNVVSENVGVGNLLKNAERIVEFCQSGEVLRKAYFLDQNMTYLDKFISSVRMHLAKCGNVNKMTCDEIVQGLMNLVK